MLFPDPITISGANCDTAFILLAWDELFNEQTLYSFRPRLLDSYQILKEIKKITELASIDERWAKSIPHMTTELKSLSKNDPILKIYYPKIHNAVNNLNENDRFLNRIVSLILSELADYSEYTRCHIKEAVKGLPRERKNMLDALNRLATRSRLEGIDYLQCNEIVADDNFQLSPSELIDLIVEITRPREREWFCVISVKGDSKKIRSFVSKTDYKILAPKNKPLGKAGKEFTERTKDGVNIQTSVKAVGAYNAATKATRDLRYGLDVLSFYYNDPSFEIDPNVIATLNRKDFILVNINEHSHLKLKPHREAKNLIKELLSSIQLNELPEQLTNALEQKSISDNESLNLKIKFLNLWIALETLTGRKEISVIGSMLRYITPVVINNRVRKQIKYLAISLKNHGFPEIRKFHFIKSGPLEVQRNELLLCLLDEPGCQSQRWLCDITKNHPLLLFRLFLMHQNLQSPNELRKALMESFERTNWQLRRIYRARNLIVHLGEEPDNLSYLYENLRDYFNLTVDRIIGILKNNPSWSINQCFESQVMEYDHLISVLGNDPYSVKVSDLMQEHGDYHCCPAYF